jgi:hypothetical protein
MKLPASSEVLFFAVSDRKQHVVENNSGKGYIVFLKDPSAEGFEQLLAEKITHTGLADHFLKLDYTLQDILDEYESLFTTYPYLKNESPYASYLWHIFSDNKEETRPKLIDLAEKLEKKDDEKSLNAAYRIYDKLGMDNELAEVAKVILEKYPSGILAKQEFWKEYTSVRDGDPTYISNKIDDYISLFGNQLDQYLKRFYYDLIYLFLERKDTLNIAKYEKLVTNKILWIDLYNDYAWQSAGLDLTSPGKNLEFAAGGIPEIP